MADPSESSESDLPSWSPPTSNSIEPVFDDWYQSLYANRLPPPPLGQPSNSVPQELGISVDVRSSVSTHDTLDDHAMTFGGGSSDHVNFDMSPRLSHWPQGQPPAMMNRQAVVFATPPPSSFRYPLNSHVQQSLFLESQAPVPGTSQIASETPLPSLFSNSQHFNSQHAVSATLSQSQAPMGTRHIISEIQSLPSFPGPNSYSNSNDQCIASSSHVVPLPVSLESNHIHSLHTGPSLQWKALLGTSTPNFEVPPRLLQEFHFQNFSQAPTSNNSFNFELLPRIPSSSLTLAHELNVQNTGSDGPLAGSSGRRTVDIQKHRFSPLPGSSDMNFTAIQDTITEKLGHARWKTSQDGTSFINKLKCISKTIWADFEKSTNIFVLPAYELSLNPMHSKEQNATLHIAHTETLLTNHTFLDAWIMLLDNKSGQFKWFCVPFGHGVVVALIEYMLVTMGYSWSISFGESGWQKRLQNTITAISTVYHSALLKFKGDSGWIEAGAPDDTQYLLFVQRMSLLSEADKWMFEQLLDGLMGRVIPSVVMNDMTIEFEYVSNTSMLSGHDLRWSLAAVTRSMFWALVAPIVE
ncbi:uncharacterized protein EDB93DRAFT_1106204 [Suillus bovinus]|uniref:uncharacterized protein n=1 Tax=Suillus bovinus TaxID=48563 RepID=UPI001B864FDB|nr:uncharacterized protein EDB93DRAFT_1106204 [Suillus bovinus]KAG2139098.1 hypothetical protein EDB93DRAFT_1106204 [Suillus bovinus]